MEVESAARLGALVFILLMVAGIIVYHWLLDRQRRRRKDPAASSQPSAPGPRSPSASGDAEGTRPRDQTR